MRVTLFYLTIWAAAQSAAPFSTGVPRELLDLIQSVLLVSGLVAAVYRLGALRQQIEDTNKAITAETARFRTDLDAAFQSLDRRFAPIDAFIAAATQRQLVTERWEERVDMRLDIIERASPARRQDAA